MERAQARNDLYATEGDGQHAMPTTVNRRAEHCAWLELEYEPGSAVPGIMAQSPSPRCKTVWTLHRNKSAVKLCAREIAGRGVLMCYSVNDAVVMTVTLRDGPDMLREAAALRFGLEARGWAAPNWCARRVPRQLTRSSN